MHKAGKWLIVGVAVAALAGSAAIAEAQSPVWHTLTVRLPGGGVEHMTYSGNVRPEIIVLPNSGFGEPFLTSFGAPFTSFWRDPVFAQMDRISAAMNREMSAMLRSAETVQANVQQGLYNASLGQASPGTVDYSQLSTWTRHGVCTRTVRLVEPRNGGKPQVVSNTSGDCTGAHASAPAAGAIPAKAVAMPHEVSSLAAL